MSRTKRRSNGIYIRRIVMTVVGVMFLGVAVGFFNYSNFGIDPFQTFAHGIALHVPLQFGTTYMIINAVELVVIFLIDRSKIGLGTMINLFLLGYSVEFSSDLIRKLFDGWGGGLTLQIISLLIGIVLMCFCAALYFSADLGVSTHDAIALIISERQSKVPFAAVRIANDIVCVVIGVLLGQIAGIGTLISALFTGPLVAFFRRHCTDKMLAG